MNRTSVPALLLLACLPARAATIESLSVIHDGTRYSVEMQVKLQAPPAASYAAFADPASLQKINPAVQRVEVLQRVGDDRARIYTEVRVCALFYCKTLHQTQDMHYLVRADGGDLTAEVVPEASDFSHGQAHWQFRPAAGGATQLHFHAELEPAFWIPPVIGPLLVERSLRDEAERTSAGIELLAQTAQLPDAAQAAR